MSYDRDDVFAEPPHVTPQQLAHAAHAAQAARLEVAQRMAEALQEALIGLAAIDDNRAARRAEQMARAALAEWEKQ